MTYEEILDLLSLKSYRQFYIVDFKIAAEYTLFIAGAPVSLNENQRLLELLMNNAKDEKDSLLLSRFYACSYNAINALKNRDCLFSVELINVKRGTVNQHKNSFQVSTPAEAQKVIS